MVFDSVWALKFHASRNHELLHVLKGKMVLTYRDGRKYEAGPGNTLFNISGTEHKDIFDLDDELSIFFIQFQWEHSEEFFNKVTNEFLLTSQNNIEARRIFDVMRLDTGSGEIDRIVANSRLANILSLLYRDASCPEDKNEKSRQKQLVQNAKKYIDHFFRNPIRLEDVAEHLKVSPFYLSRTFSSESDFSLIDYLTEARINEAKKLLSDGRYIVADVARMVGYEDSNYFSKVFKRRIGTSPCKFH